MQNIVIVSWILFSFLWCMKSVVLRAVINWKHSLLLLAAHRVWLVSGRVCLSIFSWTIEFQLSTLSTSLTYRVGQSKYSQLSVLVNGSQHSKNCQKVSSCPYIKDPFSKHKYIVTLCRKSSPILSLDPAFYKSIKENYVVFLSCSAEYPQK